MTDASMKLQQPRQRNLLFTGTTWNISPRAVHTVANDRFRRVVSVSDTTQERRQMQRATCSGVAAQRYRQRYQTESRIDTFTSGCRLALRGKAKRGEGTPSGTDVTGLRPGRATRWRRHMHHGFGRASRGSRARRTLG
ncbi:hypothetical protein [Mycolicibacterium chubuense]|uniref:hypothetical protein n=1 Tax=Mycolicibacterium chubuense TaxID=1800 RepID=UPI0013013E3A|nr:hypothetical protein [Mycolicibacterium chubuense]